MLSNRLPAVVAAALAVPAASVAVPSAARAGDADATAVAATPSGVYVGGSTFHSGDLRSGVVGRWNPATSTFDWLERIEGAPGAADGITDVVAAGSFVYAVGYGNGALVVAKIDPATGTLQRSCGPTGVAANSLGASILPGKAAPLGDDFVVVGATLALPTRGVIAIVDGATCAVRASAMLGAADPQSSVGFTTVSVDTAGYPVVAGFSGTDAALFRFAPDLTPALTRTVDLGGLLGEAFTALAIGPEGGVAAGLSGTTLHAQCFNLPALTAQSSCGAAGRTTLSFGQGAPTGTVTVSRRPRGGYLVGGSELGWGVPAGFLARAALTALEPAQLHTDLSVFAPTGRQLLDAFPYAPSAITAITANDDTITATGTAGYPGTRQPFLFTATADGATPVVTPLDGFENAKPAPVQPAPPTPAAPATEVPASAPPPAATKRAALATARWSKLTRRPGRTGAFGTLSLKCARRCSAKSTYRAKVRGRTLTLGATSARLAAGDSIKLRLALSRKGRARLVKHRRLTVTVRVRVTGTTGKRERALFQTTVRLTKRS